MRRSGLRHRRCKRTLRRRDRRSTAAACGGAPSPQEGEELARSIDQQLPDYFTRVEFTPRTVLGGPEIRLHMEAEVEKDAEGILCDTALTLRERWPELRVTALDAAGRAVATEEDCV
jgi:hypothetical protein